jgi:hypothetical protein
MAVPPFSVLQMHQLARREPARAKIFGDYQP